MTHLAALTFPTGETIKIFKSNIEQCDETFWIVNTMLKSFWELAGLRGLWVFWIERTRKQMHSFQEQVSQTGKTLISFPHWRFCKTKPEREQNKAWDCKQTWFSWNNELNLIEQVNAHLFSTRFALLDAQPSLWNHRFYDPVPSKVHSVLSHIVFNSLNLFSIPSNSFHFGSSRLISAHLFAFLLIFVHLFSVLLISFHFCSLSFMSPPRFSCLLISASSFIVFSSFSHHLKIRLVVCKMEVWFR